MPRKYVKVSQLTDTVFKLKAEGKTNREIAEKYHLTKEQIKNLVKRYNRKKRLVSHGYMFRKKGRPCKNNDDPQTRMKNRIAELEMQVDVLQNFLYEVGRK